MVNNPLIRPYFLGGGVAWGVCGMGGLWHGGVGPLDYREIRDDNFDKSNLHRRQAPLSLVYLVW